MKPCLTALLVIFGMAATATLAHADEKTLPAIQAAESWLGLVDANEFNQSWTEAALLFKSAVSEKKWNELIASVRDPLGKVASRELLTARFTPTLPGAPVGEYVVIQFKTNFAEKPGAIETLTPMKDETGTWRVSGYFIK